jgi:hypothetical protein
LLVGEFKVLYILAIGSPWCIGSFLTTIFPIYLHTVSINHKSF